jgi:hypothetical protein
MTDASEREYCDLYEIMEAARALGICYGLLFTPLAFRLPKGGVR